MLILGGPQCSAPIMESLAGVRDASRCIEDNLSFVYADSNGYPFFSQGTEADPQAVPKPRGALFRVTNPLRLINCMILKLFGNNNYFMQSIH